VVVAQKVILCGDGVWVLGKNSDRYVLGRFLNEDGIGNRNIQDEKFQIMGQHNRPFGYPDLGDLRIYEKLKAYECIGYTCSVEWLSGSFDDLIASAERI
jgi:hypothetical protein